MKQKAAKKDICLMLFFIVLSLVLLVWIIPKQIKVTAMMDAEAFSPRTFPYLIASTLLLVSVIGLFNSSREYIAARREEGPESHTGLTAEERMKILFPYLFFALIVVYGLMFRFLGIIPATIIVPPIMLWILRCRKWQMYVCFFVFACIVYLVFTRVLLVPIR